VKRVGDRATLLELADNAAVHAAAHAARQQLGQQLEDVVPGHTTLLLVWKEGHVVSDLETLEHASKADTTETGPTVTIPVNYDGVDLEAVAAKLDMSPEAVAELHSEAEYTVAFMGFAPGFPYLIAGEPFPLLELPRLETPRTEVPAGAVAVAAGYCGIYPRSSPGGWNLLGQTDVVLFDAARDRPALLEPGTRVRFEPV
jgi:KipI family sensor histidine kinase inhibitor